MSLSVEVIGLTEFVADAKSAGVNAEPLVRAALFNSVTEIQRSARDRAPHRTGTLQRSILTSVTYPTATVQVQEKYGSYVEYGTAPHDIYPKNKKALYWKGALNPYKMVHHPGTRPKPFFKPAIDASSFYIQAQFDKIMDKIMERLKG